LNVALTNQKSEEKNEIFNSVTTLGNSIESVQDDNIEFLLYLIIGLVCFVVFFGIYIAYFNTKPIKHLRTSIQNILNGNLGTRLNYKVNTELDDLAHSFNSMLDYIEDYNSKLQKTNIKIKAKSEKLQESNKMLENYAYITSHDLKQALRNVHSFVNLLIKQNKVIDDADSKKYIEFILNSCDHMMKTVSSLLELNKLSNFSESEKEFKNENLREIIYKSITMLNIEIYESNATIENKTENIFLNCNANLLVSVFQNLLSNSIKHCEKDPQIEIKSSFNNTHCKIYVKDNGIGIKEENFKKIFQLFHKDSNTSNSNGIGLATVAKIMKIHDSKIVLLKSSGEGSTFILTFKLNSKLIHTDNLNQLNMDNYIVEKDLRNTNSKSEKINEKSKVIL